MTGYTSVTVDISDVEEGIDAMERRAHALTPAFVEIKAAMKADQKDHRELEEGPDGHWPARSAATIARAKKSRGRKGVRRKSKGRRLPRKVLGKLPTAVSYKALPYGAIGESRVKWSEIHQTGGVVGHHAKLPARPFLWISDRLLNTSEQIVEKHLLAAYGGSR